MTRLPLPVPPFFIHAGLFSPVHQPVAARAVALHAAGVRSLPSRSNETLVMLTLLRPVALAMMALLDALRAPAGSRRRGHDIAARTLRHAGEFCLTGCRTCRWQRFRNTHGLARCRDRAVFFTGKRHLCATFDAPWLPIYVLTSSSILPAPSHRSAHCR